MDKPFQAEVGIVINAPASKVWEALTTPALIKQYFFGTEVVTDWKVGSPITYRGDWQGKSYEDKGVILAIEPEKHLLSTYWSGMSGTPDVPENYSKVGYTLIPEGAGTKLTVTQGDIATQEMADHVMANWTTVLNGLKKLLEK